MGESDTTPYQDGIDEHIGSFLERWTTQDTGPFCRFCRIEIVGPGVELEDKFCGEDCREAFQEVIEARLVIGERDIAQRGYD